VTWDKKVRSCGNEDRDGMAKVKRVVAHQNSLSLSLSLSLFLSTHTHKHTHMVSPVGGSSIGRQLRRC
jgi:hypothetical protein